MKPPFSPLQAGSCSGFRSPHFFEAILSSSRLFLCSKMLCKVKQNGLAAGEQQTDPFQLLSCQGTRIDKCFIYFRFIFYYYVFEYQWHYHPNEHHTHYLSYNRHSQVNDMSPLYFLLYNARLQTSTSPSEHMAIRSCLEN